MWFLNKCNIIIIIRSLIYNNRLCYKRLTQNTVWNLFKSCKLLFPLQHSRISPHSLLHFIITPIRHLAELFGRGGPALPKAFTVAGTKLYVSPTSVAYG
jgi:hypothetical protein